jgi:hypothetical protein
MQKSHREWAWRACKCSGTTTVLALSSGGHLARLVMVRGNREPVPDRKLGFRERPISKHAVTAALLYGPTAPVPPWVPAGIMQANVVPEDLAFDLTCVPKASVTTRRSSMAVGIHGCRGHTALRGWWPSGGPVPQGRPPGVSRTCRRPLARPDLRLPAWASAEARRRLVDHHSAAKDKDPLQLAAPVSPRRAGEAARDPGPAVGRPWHSSRLTARGNLPPQLICACPMFSIRSRRIRNSHRSKIRNVL